jgi:hypothetical protein
MNAKSLSIMRSSNFWGKLNRFSTGMVSPADVSRKNGSHRLYLATTIFFEGGGQKVVTKFTPRCNETTHSKLV